MILQMGDWLFLHGAAAPKIDTIHSLLKQICHEESFLISFSAIILAI